MTLRTRAAAALSPFAHLAGFGPRRAPKAEGEPPKDAPDAEGEEEEAEDKATDPKDPPPEPNGEDDKAGEGAAEDEGDPEEEDPDEEMRGNSAAAQARRRERARCAAIFASPHAAGRADVAAQLAFHTTMPRSAAVASLAALAGTGAGAGRGRGRSLDERMEGADNPRLPPGGGEKPAAAQVAASWDAAMKRAAR
ncbi:hypothetical protein [Neoroseomonas lacus]|uniref:Uncharacterized protein n=1 Tax=Neoroseomonas lacus TaxID=287609 RepID=A0A917KIV2_9PROT|nr:hypothetical protein [Neoroseomonas lacus]GGJ14153.1 hypothetical protein GCM10011320_21780 [Neoroseomonas lacus]